MSSPMVGGNIILARRSFVVARGGEALWGRVLARLGPDASDLKRTMLVTQSYPLELNLRLDQAIAEELYPGEPDRAFLEMGRSSARGGAHTRRPGPQPPCSPPTTRRP